MAASCYHCGLPIPIGSHYQAAVLGEPRVFCCLGCQAVAETIVAHGLDHYYRHRHDAAINPEILPKVLLDELKLYDRPEIQRPFVQNTGNVSTASLLIKGITCAACGWLIERHLRHITGVLEVRLNLSNHRLHLAWDTQQQTLSHLLYELRQIGYVAYPYQADQATEQLAQENRRTLRQLGMAGLLWMQVMMASMATWPEFNLDLSAGMDRILRWTAFILTTPIIFYCSADFFRGAWRDLRTHHLTMDVSVSLAMGGAYLAGAWSTFTGQGELYVDTVGMFAFFLLAGRYLERQARARTAEATAQLIQLLPASCLKLDAQGQTKRILLSELQVGDQLRILPGELIPADSLILSGYSAVDESALTGEYLPLPRQPGDRVMAGSLNTESPLTLQVYALGDQTQLSAIIRLLERAQSDKPKLAELADRVAQWFLMTVLIAAAILGVVWWSIDAQRALWVVLALLVATCPCALSLATPTALTSATGALHRLGLLVTRGHVLECLNQVDTVVFDKTGTLTEGRLTLSAVHPLGEWDQAACLNLAAALECHSEHPIARAFTQGTLTADQVINRPGLGLEGQIGTQSIRIGQPAFVAEGYGLTAPAIPGTQGQWLLLGNNHGPIAWLVLDDRLREDAQALVQACRQRGWNPVLLSGDTSPMVAEIAHTLGITQAEGGLTPAAKLAQVQALQAQGHCVLMLGDGVNDAPVLAGANVSIAMGSGTDLAKTSADAILLSNRLKNLISAFQVASRTRHIIWENLLWAGLYNGLVLPFAALGWITPLWAALGMSFSSLLVVLNALRLTRLP